LFCSCDNLAHNKNVMIFFDVLTCVYVLIGIMYFGGALLL